MANPEHLQVLQQGVEAWNAWREANNQVEPDLSGADLRAKRLMEANLTRTDLSRTNLRTTILYRAQLAWASFAEADLSFAYLTHADFSVSNLFKANLNNALLNSAMLVGAHLVETNFTEANLEMTLIQGANLYMADFHRARIGLTVFADTDLSMVQGLDTVLHRNPSSIDIHTIYSSRGNIPDIFLRGAGVSDEFIAYVQSLVGRPFEYYSCFISYSGQDEALAKRLYADLQANGVRCWFAPEDMKIGDEFRSRIDTSIHLHDRLLLILSEHSIKSRWVQKEVETAFEKEEKGHRLVLFPLRLDNAIMEMTVGWAADIRRQRHIGDFTQWKEHDSYQQAFRRLLRDLKAEGRQPGG
jgi:hypothetical protein